MQPYDLCLAWSWEYDLDFVRLLAAACSMQGRSLLEITDANLTAMLDRLARGEVAFGALVDRASDADARFMAVVEWANAHAARCLNPQEPARRSWDKATMHLELISAGVQTPYTIILDPYHKQPALPALDLSPLGKVFTVKPAHGGGGEGVVAEAVSLADVRAARQQFPADKYLLQARITPAVLGARPAWFRPIYCLGRVHLCWWDTRTHIYTPVSALEEQCYDLSAVRSVTAAVARVCGLELFSTEIALVPDGRFVVVDYVNDQLDLRVQSRIRDGVPDSIVCDIATGLAEYAVRPVDAVRAG